MTINIYFRAAQISARWCWSHPSIRNWWWVVTTCRSCKKRKV